MKQVRQSATSKTGNSYPGSTLKPGKKELQVGQTGKTGKTHR